MHGKSKRSIKARLRAIVGRCRFCWRHLRPSCGARSVKLGFSCCCWTGHKKVWMQKEKKCLGEPKQAILLSKMYIRHFEQLLKLGCLTHPIMENFHNEPPCQFPWVDLHESKRLGKAPLSHETGTSKDETPRNWAWKESSTLKFTSSACSKQRLIPIETFVGKGGLLLLLYVLRTKNGLQSSLQEFFPCHLHSRKLTWNPKLEVLKTIFLSRGWFSGSMFVLGGVQYIP